MAPVRGKMPEERVKALLGELDFLDLCQLVLYFAEHHTTMSISWKHARAEVIVNPRRRKGKQPAMGETPR